MLNDLMRYANTDRQRQVLETVIKAGSNNKAARELNCGRRTVDKIIDTLKARQENDKTIEISQPPIGDETIEEILARKRNLYTRKKQLEDFSKLIHIAVKENKPIGLCLIGDPHVDDDGCDIHKLESDLTVIRDTVGMYAGHLGDITNNWIGRLARLYAHQTPQQHKQLS